MTRDADEAETGSIGRGATGSPAAERGADGGEPPREVTFTLDGVLAGFRTCAPVAIGVGSFGLAFGVLARQAGLNVAEATLMSATVLAGASQLVAIELWAEPIPIAAIVLTTLVINLRYSLMGAALQPWFAHLSAKRAYVSLFFMADENWALTMSELRSSVGDAESAGGSGDEPEREGVNGAFLLGSGLAIWVCWVGATIVGATAGGAFGDPARYGLDFVLTGVFVALAVELWEGRSSLLPWAGALATAIVTAQVLPGRWYILLGGLAAATLEVLRYDRSGSGGEPK